MIIGSEEVPIKPSIIEWGRGTTWCMGRRKSYHCLISTRRDTSSLRGNVLDVPIIIEGGKIVA